MRSKHENDSKEEKADGDDDPVLEEQKQAQQ